MCDEEQEKDTYWSFIILTSIMIIVNIIALVWSNIKVSELMGNDKSITAARYAKEALATVVVGAFSSIGVETISLLVPKTNICKVLNILEIMRNKLVCITFTVALQLLIIFNGVSAFIAARDLIFKSIENIF